MQYESDSYNKLVRLTKTLTSEELDELKFVAMYLKAHPGEPLPPFEEMHKLYLSTKSAA